MREMLELAAEPRSKMGKGAAHQTRKSGRIPAIVYGGQTGPQTIQVDERTFGRLYGTGVLLQTLVMLEVEGKKTRVLPRAVQLDPVTDRPIHIDFMRLVPGARIRLGIPVRFRGQENSPGLKLGGVLNIVRHEIEVYCPADNIPEYIEGDLDGLEIGDSLHISHFTLPQGVKPAIRERDFTVATIAPPTTFVEETPVTAAAEGEAVEGAPVEGAEGVAAAPGAAPGAPGTAPAAAGATAAAPAAAEKGKPAAKK
jgi:large subunit ribosomal protein L25